MCDVARQNRAEARFHGDAEADLAAFFLLIVRVVLSALTGLPLSALTRFILTALSGLLPSGLILTALT